jgi:D-3-phosphoglycerate dehydrogenase
MTFRVLVSDKLSERGLEVFRRAGPEIEVDARPDLGKNPDALMQIIGDYDALAVRSATQVTPELLERAEKLKVIGRAGIGVDNINLDAASKRGIVVMNTPDGNVITTAEHAISLMCALCRRIPQATASMRAGKWEKSKFQGRELFAKNLGIVGLGNIGRIVADRAKGLRMNVLAYDPFVTQEKAQAMGVRLLNLDELLAEADIVTLHVPLMDATRNIIDAKAIAKMKPGALLINAARGGLVDEAAVVEALKTEHLGGAAFDVYETEPPASDHPLLGLDQVILTPHLGASTTEAQDNVAVAVAHQIIALLTKGTVENAINAPSVPAEVLAQLGPYIELGRKLGGFAGQVHEGGIDEIRMHYAGTAAEQRVDPITVAALSSVLNCFCEATVNDINAPHIAKDRGIECIEEKTNTAKDFVTTVGITLKGQNGSTEIIGAVFGSSDVRIVEVNGMRLEVIPEGHLILTKHSDKPGIVGKIGNVLGAGKINISRMMLGLGSDYAHAAISVDSAVSQVVLAEIAHIDGIKNVRPISF